MRFVGTFILIIIITIGTLLCDESPYRELKTVQLQFEENLFSSISDVEYHPDGFLVLLSRGSQNNLIVILDKSGKIKHLYDKTGNGPGELRHIFNIVEHNALIYASEATSPFIRKFTRELKFVKDYKIKKAGKLFYLKDKQFGIWGPNYTDEGAFQLALYDQDFEPVRQIYHVKEVPALFHFWGGVTEGFDNNYIIFHPVHFRLDVFDKKWNFKGKLLKNVPSHIVPYKKFKGSPYKVDSKAIEWSRSWSVLQSVYFSRGKYILKYLHNNRTYIDVYDKKGNILVSHFQEKKGDNISFIDRDENLWKLRVLKADEDEPQYFLVKVELKTSENRNENPK